LVDARGWTHRVFTLERMKEGERAIAPWIASRALA
jgi:hypothetical protein